MRHAFLCLALAEAEEQNDNGDQDDPKQNVFTENTTSAVHRVTPFFDTCHFWQAHFQDMCPDGFGEGMKKE